MLQFPVPIKQIDFSKKVEITRKVSPSDARRLNYGEIKEMKPFAEATCIVDQYGDQDQCVLKNLDLSLTDNNTKISIKADFEKPSTVSQDVKYPD